MIFVIIIPAVFVAGALLIPRLSNSDDGYLAEEVVSGRYDYNMN